MSFQIRPVTSLVEAKKLFKGWVDKEGWNPGINDMEAFHRADPDGFLIGELLLSETERSITVNDEEARHHGDRSPHSKVVAIISAIKYENSAGFIGFYIVDSEHRGQGFGLKIFRQAMQRLLVDAPSSPSSSLPPPIPPSVPSSTYSLSEEAGSAIRYLELPLTPSSWSMDQCPTPNVNRPQTESVRVIGLDAVGAQVHNYRKSGFQTAWCNGRFLGSAASGLSLPPGPKGGGEKEGDLDLHCWDEIDEAALIAFDAQYSGFVRSSFLRAWREKHGSSTIAACEQQREETGEGPQREMAVQQLAQQPSRKPHEGREERRRNKVRAIGAVRKSVNGFRIGPLFATDKAAARSVLHELCKLVLRSDNDCEPIIFIDVCLENASALELIEEVGWKQDFRTHRMWHEGRSPPHINVSGIYGVSSLELG